MQRFFWPIIATIALLWGSQLSAAMTGGDFEIFADSFSFVEDVGISGGGYQLTQTGGEFFAQNVYEAATGTISIAGVDFFTVFGETFEISDGTTTSVFIFENRAGGGNGTIEFGNVVVDTGGGCDGIPGCMQARVIEAINATTHPLLVDAGSGGADIISLVNVNPDEVGDDPIVENITDVNFTVEGMSFTPSGSYILRAGFQALERGSLSLSLSTTTLALGTLSTTEVTSTSLVMTVTSDSGYGVSLTEDKNLCRTANNCDVDANNIDDVGAGVDVVAGTEGYGVRTSGGAGLLAADDAIDADGVAVANSANAATAQETEVIFQAALDATKSRAGSYSHTVTFSISANP